jgi:anti-sigma regulatory factor (Ser/Thr protein kinase)
MRLRPDPAELALARKFAAAAGSRFGLGDAQRYDFTMATSEAVANALEHGLPCWDGTIHLWTREEGETLVLAIRNAGEFVFKPPPLDPLAERGRGLTMMSKLVDEVALRRVGDHVVVELLMRRPPSDAELEARSGAEHRVEPARQCEIAFDHESLVEHRPHGVEVAGGDAHEDGHVGA